MSPAGLNVVGLARLRKTMRAAGHDVTQIRELNRAAAEVVAPAVKAATPSGPAQRGHLRNTVRATASGKAGMVRIGFKSKPYAGPVHWGWPARNIRPQPWATDAAKATEEAWTKVYLVGIQRIIDQIEGA